MKKSQAKKSEVFEKTITSRVTTDEWKDVRKFTIDTGVTVRDIILEGKISLQKKLKTR